MVRNIQPSKLLNESKYGAARVSSIELLNAHDDGFVLIGHDDGVIRVWQNPFKFEEFQNEKPNLITAWEGLPGSSYYASLNSLATLGNNSSSNGISLLSASCGILTAWQQNTQQLVVGGGNCRFLRIWDVTAEIKLSDIALGSNDTCVRVLSPFPSNVRSDIIVAGCADGSVRLYDKRCASQESRLRVFREHNSAIMAVCLQDNQNTLVSACVQGKVCVLDLRGRSAFESLLQQWDAGSDITAVSIHQQANVVACGSSHKISIYNCNNGVLHNVLRSSDSFMGQKIGQPNCLAFHPCKMCLGVGFVDNTIAIYEPSAMGRRVSSEPNFL